MLLSGIDTITRSDSEGLFCPFTKTFAIYRNELADIKLSSALLVRIARDTGLFQFGTVTREPFGGG